MEFSNLEAEAPECPVCLQPYDAVTAIPRVLTCDHTTCEACLKLLPCPFTNTIRCTVCTLLIKIPNSPSSLPKNLDLLYFSSVLQRRCPAKEKKTISPSSEQRSVLFPSVMKPWTYEFYCKWRGWILPKDCILIGDDEGGVLDREVLSLFESDRVMDCVSRGKENVGFVEVGTFVEDDVNSKLIKPSYESRILTVLWGMKEDERVKLGIIFNAALRVSNVGKAHGFWCNEEDTCVYIVFEKLASSSFIECVLTRTKDEKEGSCTDEMGILGMIGMEMCETLCRLHLEGISIGFLSSNCLGFDVFGRICVDTSEVVNTGRRVSRAVQRGCRDMEFSLKDMLLDQNLVFLSPEMMSHGGVSVGFPKCV